MQTWWRLHSCHRDAVYFGCTGRNRFDAPGCPNGEYRALYAAADVYGAFIETLGRETGKNRVDLQTLRVICLARLETTRPLDLVDLTGTGLTHVGADAGLWAGRDYTLCGRWALAFWRHPQQPDGLYYSSRHDPHRGSLVLFDRAQEAVQSQGQGALADQKHMALLVDILDTYRFQLLP
jgi:hypothetical protein